MAGPRLVTEGGLRPLGWVICTWRLKEGLALLAQVSEGPGALLTC